MPTDVNLPNPDPRGHGPMLTALWPCCAIVKQNYNEPVEICKVAWMSNTSDD